MAIIEGCDVSSIDRTVRYMCHSDDTRHVSGTVGACSDGYHFPIRANASEKLGVDPSEVKCSFDEIDTEADAHMKPSSPDESVVIKTRMARDCGPNFNLRNIVHHNHFTCRYVGPVTFPDGKQALSRPREYKGMLPSCGVGTKASSDVLADVRELVYDAVGGGAMNLKKENFECRIMGVPPH